ncbi:hypothetical protein PUMCH_001341 [Australozyma saopauloensis]|uniref:40S ribosomal protein S18 n=1 Tax=Australozyma saopauloensis TaxID=291208 RepID=A0AAX4H683_9ASCO|nr:hypothetical protein PUMCH_001341 [[Candida] saopauloensis]
MNKSAYIYAFETRRGKPNNWKNTPESQSQVAPPNTTFLVSSPILSSILTDSLLNTNIDGRIKVMYALTKIRGVGRRYSNLICKKADIDLNKRAGELTQEELERVVTIMQNPGQYKVPAWFLNRQKDQVTGKDVHVLANGLESKLRDDLERLKKIRSHRGIRHFWGLKVRGQHTKTTSRGR